jgi:hypothetical protein
VRATRSDESTRRQITCSVFATLKRMLGTGSLDMRSTCVVRRAYQKVFWSILGMSS